MTTRKRFKALIRAYAREHNLSYTAALRQFRTLLTENAEKKPMTVIRKIDLGFSFEQPESAKVFDVWDAGEYSSSIHRLSYVNGDDVATVTLHYLTGSDLETHVEQMLDQFRWVVNQSERRDTELTLSSHDYLRVRFTFASKQHVDIYFLMRADDCFVFECHTQSEEFADACESIPGSVVLFDPPRKGQFSDLCLPRYTPSARNAVYLAAQVAQRRGEGELSAHHVLAGLVLNGDTSASNMLARYGITAEALDIDIGFSVDRDVDIPIGEALYGLLTERVQRLTRGKIRSMHLLLALLSRDYSEVLASRIDLPRFRYGVMRNLKQEHDVTHPFCDFCGMSADEVIKLVAGPNTYICNECVAGAHDVLETGNRRIEGSVHCSFCGKHANEVDRKMVSSLMSDEDDARRVCHECVALCLDIIEEEQHSSKQ